MAARKGKSEMETKGQNPHWGFGEKVSQERLKLNGVVGSVGGVGGGYISPGNA